MDELLKKEFDQYRQVEAHPYMDSVNRNLIPYSHEKLDEWRENFKGVHYHHKETNLIFTGAVDDLWLVKIQMKLLLWIIRLHLRTRMIIDAHYGKDTEADGFYHGYFEKWLRYLKSDILFIKR